MNLSFNGKGVPTQSRSGGLPAAVAACRTAAKLIDDWEAVVP